jgi:PAS domain S-box-containing protein
MTDGIEPVAWSGRRAVVTFPVFVGGPEAARVGEQLLGALSQGAVTLIADMSATKSCDPALAGVVALISQRAAAGQAELRLVISEPDVRHLVTADGLDRLVPVYSSLEAALAAGTPDGPAADGALVPGSLASRLTERGREQAERAVGSWPSVQADEAVLRQLIDALDDGIALTSQDGTIVLANRRLAAMLGHQPADLVGQPVEALVPAELREAHRRHRAGYARRPVARPMADRARLLAVHRDGGTVPVTITLAPVPTAGRHLVLAVVREAAHAHHRDDLIALLNAAASREAKLSRELLDRIVASLFHAGLSLQSAANLPADVARERISDALHQLDDTIHEIRDHIFRSRPPDSHL